MKIRNGFVSNSSSASFVLDLSKVTKKQRKQLDNHISIGYKILPECEQYFSDCDEYQMEEDGKGNLLLKTGMTNFSMEAFFKAIGIRDNAWVNHDVSHWYDSTKKDN